MTRVQLREDLNRAYDGERFAMTVEEIQTRATGRRRRRVMASAGVVGVAAVAVLAAAGFVLADPDLTGGPAGNVAASGPSVDAAGLDEVCRTAVEQQRATTLDTGAEPGSGSPSAAPILGAASGENTPLVGFATPDAAMALSRTADDTLMSCEVTVMTGGGHEAVAYGPMPFQLDLLRQGGRSEMPYALNLTSPDGDGWIAGPLADGVDSVVVTLADGERTVRASTGGGYFLAWVPDGGGLKDAEVTGLHEGRQIVGGVMTLLNMEYPTDTGYLDRLCRSGRTGLPEGAVSRDGSALVTSEALIFDHGYGDGSHLLVYQRHSSYRMTMNICTWRPYGTVFAVDRWGVGDAWNGDEDGTWPELEYASRAELGLGYVYLGLPPGARSAVVTTESGATARVQPVADVGFAVWDATGTADLPVLIRWQTDTGMRSYRFGAVRGMSDAEAEEYLRNSAGLRAGVLTPADGG